MRTGAWALTIALAAGVCGCAGDDAPREAQTAQAPFQVGFGRAELVWRAGAKPGQVGTHGLPELDVMFNSALETLAPIVFRDAGVPTLLGELTDWARGLLEERLAGAQPGQYSTLFEPGRGIELPPDVRAFVLQSGDTKVALVRADMYLMHEQVHRRVAELVEVETGMGRDQLFLVGTHNHSVAHASSPAPGIWIRADAFDPRHFVYVTHQIAEAIIQAHRSLKPATLRIERSELSNVQHNIIGPSKTEMAAPGSDVVETLQVGYPYDHFDSTLLLFRFDDPSGAPLGSVFVFGMHPESLYVGHGLVSGEWPRHVEERFAAQTGIEAMWLPGPLGDVEADRGRAEESHFFFRGSIDTMTMMSDLIASSVTSAWESAGKKTADPDPLLAQLADDVPGPPDYPVPDLSEAVEIRLPMVRVVQDSTAMRMHLVRIGDALLAGFPAEITTDVAYNIKSRLDDVEGNVYQGFKWPNAPAWVTERIDRNASTTELSAASGAPIPMVVSMLGGYFGYVVSRWEYENREHYRESMTFFGPGTADHLATSAVLLATELSGGPPAEFVTPEWRSIDLEGVQEIAEFLRGLDEPVREMARSFPVSDPELVGSVVAQAPAQAGIGNPARFTWIGGTNDLPPPAVFLEAQTAQGWAVRDRGPNERVILEFSPPDRWTAVWRRPTVSGSRYRFRAEGLYRGAVAGASAPHPIWDPEGKNRTYSVTSAEMSVVAEPRVQLEPAEIDPTQFR